MGECSIVYFDRRGVNILFLFKDKIFIRGIGNKQRNFFFWVLINLILT